MDPPPPTPPRHAQERVEGGEITAHNFAISPRIHASFAINFPPSPNRGRRECRAPDAPDSRVCNDGERRTRVSQVTPESPGIPRAMVYGL